MESKIEEFLRTRSAAAQAEAEKAEAQAKAEARSILEEARRTADEVFHELSDMRKKAKKEQDWQAVNDQRAGLRHRLNAAEDKLGARPQVEQPPLLRPAKKGDTVTILKTGTPGEVLSSRSSARCSTWTWARREAATQ